MYGIGLAVGIGAFAGSLELSLVCGRLYALRITLVDGSIQFALSANQETRAHAAQ